MTNSSPTPQSNPAYRDLLVEMQDWRAKKKIENIEFYSAALVANELHVIQGKEQTVRKANCDVCLNPQKPGMKKFRYIPNKGLAFWFCPCDDCWIELMKAADLTALVVAQVNTGALA